MTRPDKFVIVSRVNRVTRPDSCTPGARPKQTAGPRPKERFFTFHTGSRTYNRLGSSRPVVALTHRCPAYTCIEPLTIHLSCNIYFRCIAFSFSRSVQLFRGGSSTAFQAHSKVGAFIFSAGLALGTKTPNLQLYLFNSDLG